MQTHRELRCSDRSGRSHDRMSRGTVGLTKRERKEGVAFFRSDRVENSGFMSPLLLLCPPTTVTPPDGCTDNHRCLSGRGQPRLYQAVKCHLVRLVQTALGLRLQSAARAHGKSETSHVRNYLHGIRARTKTQRLGGRESITIGIRNESINSQALDPIHHSPLRV